MRLSAFLFWGMVVFLGFEQMGRLMISCEGCWQGADADFVAACICFWSSGCFVECWKRLLWSIFIINSE